ncbi:glutathione S-transferase U17-like [Sesamum indicum]|uniref:glutathione transferase n=1 Tax=Sesamum indicum TaxID=4182 RepID=A0A6I9TY59_SESIN|nr:glutathione S-transferase U17-like [Sesamum indicum]
MGSEEEVKVIGSCVSPFAVRTMIAFNIKCVEYKLIEENIFNKSALLLKSNPIYKKIPVLIHGQRPICESLVILQYIDEVWASGPPILPSDPYGRAIARFWAAYIDDKFFAAQYAILKAGGEEGQKAAAVEEATQILVLLEDAFTKCSKGRKFFGGDRIGYVDIALGSFLAWIRVIQKMCGVSLLDECKTPMLFQWAQHFCADAAVQDVLPETDELLEFAQLFVANLGKPTG